MAASNNLFSSLFQGALSSSLCVYLSGTCAGSSAVVVHPSSLLAGGDGCVQRRWVVARGEAHKWKIVYRERSTWPRQPTVLGTQPTTLSLLLLPSCHTRTRGGWMKDGEIERDPKIIRVK